MRRMPADAGGCRTIVVDGPPYTLFYAERSIDHNPHRDNPRPGSQHLPRVVAWRRADANPLGTSLRRGGVLDALAVPEAGPDRDWFLAALTGDHRIRADPDEKSSAATVCTFVVDLTAGDITIKPRGDRPARMALAQLVART
jgi:hypothetical protein